MKFLIRIVIAGIAVLITTYLLPGVTVDSFWTALLVAAVISLLNAVVKPVLVLFTFPLTLLTFGLFLLVINGLIIILAAALVPGFDVINFWWALAFSIIMSFVMMIFDSLAGSDGYDDNSSQ